MWLEGSHSTEEQEKNIKPIERFLQNLKSIIICI
jgi:hypothetical protein